VDLSGAQLIGTDLLDATLTGSIVYGVSVRTKVDSDTKQQNLIKLVMTSPITVDNIEVAQIIYLR